MLEAVVALIVVTAGAVAVIQFVLAFDRAVRSAAEATWVVKLARWCSRTPDRWHERVEWAMFERHERAAAKWSAEIGHGTAAQRLAEAAGAMRSRAAAAPHRAPRRRRLGRSRRRRAPARGHRHGGRRDPQRAGAPAAARPAAGNGSAAGNGARNRRRRADRAPTAVAAARNGTGPPPADHGNGVAGNGARVHPARRPAAPLATGPANGRAVWVWAGPSRLLRRVRRQRAPRPRPV